MTNNLYGKTLFAGSGSSFTNNSDRSIKLKKYKYTKQRIKITLSFFLFCEYKIRRKCLLRTLYA